MKPNSRNYSTLRKRSTERSTLTISTGALYGMQYPQGAQERADLTIQRQVPTIQGVPKVQYIAKVADIPVDVQRQVSTIQGSQHDKQNIDEVVDVPALTQRDVPNIPDADDLCLDETADEDRLEHENKKRKLPMPTEAIFESRADESDSDRFDELVLPYPQHEEKTLFANTASDDEAEDGAENEQEMTRSLVQGGESMLVEDIDAQGPGRELVQVVHAEWAQELRELREKFADDVASEITDVKK